MHEHLGRITEAIGRVGRLSGIGPDDDIYDAGFSSINALSLLLELEDVFEVTIPDHQFVAARSPRALLAILNDLKTEQPA